MSIGGHLPVPTKVLHTPMITAFTGGKVYGKSVQRIQFREEAVELVDFIELCFVVEEAELSFGGAHRSIMGKIPDSIERKH